MLYTFRYSGRGDGWTLIIEAHNEEEATSAVRWFDHYHECGRWGGSPEDPFDPNEDIGSFGWSLDDGRMDFGIQLEVGVTLIRPLQEQDPPYGYVPGKWQTHTISDDEWETCK